MTRAKSKPRGRPPTPNGEAKVLVSGPSLLMLAIEQRAKAEGVTVREAWRRAARVWLGWHEVAEINGED